MKPRKNNRAGRGAAIGFGIFVLLAAIGLLSPLRVPVLAVTGRVAPALEYRLQAQRDTMDTLQKHASEGRLSPEGRASLESVREAYAATSTQLDDRTRMNARLNLLGLFDAIRELFPWLLTFGIALPVLGGLIGAQVAVRERTVPQPPAERPTPVMPPPQPLSVERLRPTAPAAPLPSTPIQPRMTGPAPGTPVRPAYVHPAAAAAAQTSPTPPASAVQRPLPGSPVILPPDILTPSASAASTASTAAVPPKPPVAETPVSENSGEDWGFRHQPLPLESRPRPKMPPVRSSHLTDLDELEARETDPDESSGV